MTPMIAGNLERFGERRPKKNKPSMPPLKMEAKAHQASSALSTPLNAKATRILNNPMPAELR